MEEMKLSLFTDDMIVYMVIATESNKKLLDLINEFGKQGIQSQYSEIKGIPVYQQRNCRNKMQEKNPIWYSHKKNKVPRNKPSQGGKRPVLRKLYNTEETN